ncbi:MAG: hypothetical protein ACD_50C00052G0007 [uncultured bacterium]|nr:MAG: hypothetical protein ACD_50C00052G0007 [uncultured bacterium]
MSQLDNSMNILYADCMLEEIRKDRPTQVAVFLFFFFSLWWILIHIFLPRDHGLYGLFGHTYGLIAVWGGIWGFIISRAWGGFKSVMGRGLIMFSLGLFAQEFGQLAYSFYIFVLGIEIPYPSLGDIGFFGTIPFYIYGSYLIAKASGVKVSLRSLANKLQAIIVPLIMLSVAYFLFLRNYPLDFENPLKTFFDFGYPMGQAIYISIGILTYSLTRNILGGIMKNRIMLLIIAFASQFLADYSFIFFYEQYYPASILDYMYVVAYFLMTLSILQMRTVLSKLRGK